MRHWTWIALAWAVLVADAQAQCLVTKITGERGVASGGFGRYVAAQGDELFVASTKSESTGTKPGSIYVMRREGLHWYREAEIVAPDEVAFFFGVGLTVEGDTLVTGGFMSWGDVAVYVYQRSGGVWSLTGRLDSLPFNAPPQWAAIEGDRIAIGACRDSSIAHSGGSVRIYRETAGDWQLEQHLIPDDARYQLFFGYSLDLDGERLVVGAPDFLTSSGAAYVYERRSDEVAAGTDEWVLTAKLGVQDPHSELGYSVSLDGDRLAAVDTTSVREAPAAYVFENQAGSWIQTARLVPENAEERFGETLELMGDRLFASGAFAGHLFERTASGWDETALEPLDAEPNLRVTVSAATADFAFLGFSGNGAWDQWGESSDQRAFEGGAVLAYSLAGERCASLRVTRRPISYGKHELLLSRGPASAGHVYHLIGSMSGTSPGTRVRGQRVPLNLDPYFRWTAFAPNRGAFTNNFGRLDANGEATVRLDVPPEAVALFEGRNLDHAFLEFSEGKLVHVSNVAQVRFFHRLR